MRYKKTRESENNTNKKYKRVSLNSQIKKLFKVIKKSVCRLKSIYVFPAVLFWHPQHGPTVTVVYLSIYTYTYMYIYVYI